MLTGLRIAVRHQKPHITLMHPGNSNCTNEIFVEIQKSKLPELLPFNKISLIEQIGGGQWQILKTFKLSETQYTDNS
ncbi:MAG: hypothetical protein JST17_05495 [Bacteroidetes bacterium]|nr:hypothetical protein [Bacteroidota bacterium]MBS1932265.1 hypothetical protein [Bacteroidota bacterium]